MRILLIVIAAVLALAAAGFGVYLSRSGPEPVTPRAVVSPSPPLPQSAPPPPNAKTVPAPAPFKTMRRETLPEAALERDPHYDTADDAIRILLDDALGRPAKYKALKTREHAGWIYICGEVLETNGEPFDYRRSYLKERALNGQIDNVFCSLMKTGPKGYAPREMSVGSTDNPMESWQKRYNLPERLLQ